MVKTKKRCLHTFWPCPENEAILSLPSPIIWAKRFFIIRKVPVHAFSRKNGTRCKMYVQVADNGENDLGTRVSRACTGNGVYFSASPISKVWLDVPFLVY